MAHTKGELKIMPYTRRDGHNIRWIKDEKGNVICQTFKPHAKAKAQHIVKCWNAFEKGGSHDALLDRLRNHGQNGGHYGNCCTVHYRGSSHVPPCDCGLVELIADAGGE